MTPTRTTLERAALRLFRASKTVDRDLRPDPTCKCAWCSAQRNFIQCCIKSMVRKK